MCPLCSSCFRINNGPFVPREKKLEIKALIGNTSEKEAATAILPLVKRHHLLLVTLLLFNAVSNEALPVFLEEIVPNYVAVLLSVTLVLICGEIIPSALFTGPGQLALVTKLSSFVWGLIYILYPISYPISLLLDYAFGCEGHDGDEHLTRRELEAIIIMNSPTMKEAFIGSMQRMVVSDGQNICNSDDDESSTPHTPPFSRKSTASNLSGISSPYSHKPVTEFLSRDEIGIMTGVMRLSQMTARDLCIPVKDVCMVSDEMVLDKRGLKQILDIGYSRIPVYRKCDRENIRGFLLVKELIVVDPNDNCRVSDMTIREPLIVTQKDGLLDILNMFQEGKSHLALVSRHPKATLNNIKNTEIPLPNASRIQGIITLENIFEKIIQEDILDEMDLTRSVSLFQRLESMDVTADGLGNTLVRRALSHTIRRSVDAACNKDLGAIIVDERTQLLPPTELSKLYESTRDDGTNALELEYSKLSISTELSPPLMNISVDEWEREKYAV